MYGFKPRAAQRLADGGFVATAKRMIGMKPDDPAEAARLAEYKANAAREKAAAKAPAAPAPAAAITQYTGMAATERRMKEQGLADGGLVAKMKSADAGAAPFGSRGLNQLREMPAKMQAMGFGPAKAEAPAGDRGAAGLKAMIPQMEAMGYKQQPQAAADGGLIRGPGTGTSDSIPDEMEPGTFIMPADSTQALGLDDEAGEGEKVPVRVSDGEYQLPPERVQAIGAAVLEAIKGATHTPTGQGEAPEGEQPMARGFKPKGEPQQFFAEGGRVKSPEELERMRNQTAMYVQGAQAAAASRPPAPVANQPTANPISKPMAAAPAPAPSPASPSGLYMQDRTNEMREQVGAGNYAQAAGTAARTAVQGLGMYGIELADKVATPAVNLAAGFGRGLMGGSDATAAQPTAAPAPSAPMPATASTPAAPTSTNPTDMRLATGAQTAQSGTAPTAAPSGGTEIAPGVFRNAPGQYSDNAGGIGMPAGFTGKPSAQNMAAADNLAQRSAGAAPAAAGFPGVTAPTVRNSTNDWAARKALENAATAASSITANGGAFDTTGPGDSPAQAAYKAALATDQVMQQAQPGADITAMRENAGLQREGVQQAGATTRAGMQEAGANSRDAARVNLAGQELGMKREAQGFQTRAAAQLENLQTAYTNEKDPGKQAEIARQIRGLQGKTDPAEWAVQVTPSTKNADGSTTEGSVIRYNKATGQAERVDVGQGTKTQQFKAGEVYQDAAGNKRKWNGASWDKV
ncbi:hypothetical protein [Acidovorax sp. BL-A-41-H1]|uniref:hypothetical protein n=1 Tax=Acidovorax sp. BL-A-41-H1 TaxID=3421102 RepID=UPI003F793749